MDPDQHSSLSNFSVVDFADNQQDNPDECNDHPSLSENPTGNGSVTSEPDLQNYCFEDPHKKLIDLGQEQFSCVEEASYSPEVADTQEKPSLEDRSNLSSILSFMPMVDESERLSETANYQKMEQYLLMEGSDENKLTDDLQKESREADHTDKDGYTEGVHDGNNAHEILQKDYSQDSIIDNPSQSTDIEDPTKNVDQEVLAQNSDYTQLCEQEGQDTSGGVFAYQNRGDAVMIEKFVSSEQTRMADNPQLPPAWPQQKGLQGHDPQCLSSYQQLLLLQLKHQKSSDLISPKQLLQPKQFSLLYEQKGKQQEQQQTQQPHIQQQYRQQKQEQPNQQQQQQQKYKQQQCLQQQQQCQQQQQQCQQQQQQCRHKEQHTWQQLASGQWQKQTLLTHSQREYDQQQKLQYGRPQVATPRIQRRGGPNRGSIPSGCRFPNPQLPVGGDRGGHKSLPFARQEHARGHVEFASRSQSGSNTGADKPDTIRVEGVGDSVDLELLQLYFESPKKSGGGVVCHVTDSRNQGFVLVTFQDPEAVDRVLEQSHTLSKKPLTVTRVDKKSEDEAREEKEGVPEADLSSSNTVEVSIAGEETMTLEAYLIELYFENNKRSGGGKITNVKMVEESGIALVTFEDPAVAAAVLGQKHKLFKKELRVVPYTPQKAAPVSTKVLVSELPSRAPKELLELYFEKQGSSDVEDVELDTTSGKAVVTFADPKAVQKVLGQEKHIIMGQKVRVSPVTAFASTHSSQVGKESRPDPCSVKVTGIGPCTLKETLLLYFENKRRSGGGPVSNVQYETGSGLALIIFTEPEAAKNVLEKEHTIDKHVLKVSAHYPSTIPPVDQDSRQGAECQELSSVSVRGLPISTSTDSLLLYFENRRRSSGGPVEDVWLDKKKATFFVTFKTATDAARVASRSHIVSGHQIDVQFYKTPQMCKDRLLLGNLPEIQTRDELLIFVEAKSNQMVKDLLFADEEGRALVEFETPVDHDEVRVALTKKPYKGHSVTVDPVPVSSTVLVSNLPDEPPVSEELLHDYFENTRRSSGGEVEEVEVLLESQCCLVTFKDPEVAMTVANRQHKIQRCPVDVSLYMECLGLMGGSAEPTAKIPAPLIVSTDDYQKICLLENLPAIMNDFYKSLKDCYAVLQRNSTSGSAIIVCTLTSETEGALQIVKSWSEGVGHVLQHHLKDIFSEEVTATEEEFIAAQGKINELRAECSDVSINHDKAKDILQIVYKGQEQKSLVKCLASTINDVREELQRRKKYKTEMMEISQGKQLVLKKSRDFGDTANRYPDLTIKFYEKDNKLELNGIEEDVQAVRLQIYEILSNLTTLSRKWESDLHKRLILQSDAARTAVESACSDHGPDDVIAFTPTGFDVHSFSAEGAEELQVFAMKMIQRRVVKFDDDSREVTKLEEWAKKKQSIMTRNQDLMLMIEEESGLTLVSVSPSIQEDFIILRDFLQENSVKMHSFPVPHVLSDIFWSYLEKRILDLQLDHANFCLDEDNDQLVVNGNCMTIETAKGIYAGFRQQLTAKPKMFLQPSITEFLKTAAWKRQRKEIEHNYRCLFLDPEELPVDFKGLDRSGILSSPSDSESSPEIDDSDSSPETEDSQSETLPLPSQPKTEDPVDGGADLNPPKPDLPVRPRLYLSVMSDITKEEHHILVNSSNTSLEMSQGQVSKALLAAGGPGIAEELKSSYPNGVAVGGLAISGGGKLKCRKLIHCCLPTKTDVETIRKVVRETVMKCLAEADKLAMGSIGFPSLGTGNLGYPPELVAKTMFEATLDYGRQHPGTQIFDVFIILHEKDKELTKTFRKEEKVYKEMLKRSQKSEVVKQCLLSPSEAAFQGVKSYLYFKKTRGKVKKMIVGLSETEMEQAEKELIANYNDSITSTTVETPNLENWGKVHINTMKMSCSAINVDVIFNFILGKLELRGFRENIGRIPIHKTVKDAEADCNVKKNAQLLAQQVQWGCIDVTTDGEHLVPYDTVNNYNIEMAYQNGQEKVVVVDKTNTAFVINFAQMKEIPERPDDEDLSLIVIRKDKIHTLDVPPPARWSPMNGQDLDVIQLQSSSEEYTGVAENFIKSLGIPSVKIVKIERIQNLTLYKQYEAMKQHIEKAMGNVDGKQCERLRLWHGTKEDAVQGIIKYGFNRSYSDQEKSAYGQGAYFAETAEYSSRNEYAKMSPYTKERNMFRCKVLVGEYRKGSTLMRYPPEISPGRRCHSTVDDEKTPKIFVTYSDVQAYPEYKIVFKDN